MIELSRWVYYKVLLFLQSQAVVENNLFRVDLSAALEDRYALVQKLSIAIEQVVCTALGLLILSSEGKVYTINYNDAEPVSLRFHSF